MESGLSDNILIIPTKDGVKIAINGKEYFKAVENPRVFVNIGLSFIEAASEKLRGWKDALEI